MYKYLLLFCIVLFLSVCGGKKAEPKLIAEIELADRSVRGGSRCRAGD